MKTTQRIIKKKRFRLSPLSEEEKLFLSDLLDRRHYLEHSFTEIASAYGTTKTTLIKRYRDVLEKAKELKEE